MRVTSTPGSGFGCARSSRVFRLIDQILDRLPERPADACRSARGGTARRHGDRRGISRRRPGLAPPARTAASNAATCAIHPGFNGRCSRLRSKTTSSRTFHSATNRSTVPIPARPLGEDDAQAALSKACSGRPLTEQAPLRTMPPSTELATALGRAARRRLGRSLSIREVDAGSCNGCELEIHALNNAYYDVERFGLRFVASPRHADVLMVTGPGDQEHARCAGANLSCDPQSEMGGRGRRLRPGWRLFRRQLRGGRRRLRGRSRSISIFPAARRRPIAMLQGLLACSIERPKPSFDLRQRDV